jgi:hypothetical protein
MQSLDPQQERAIRELVAEALSQANVSPRAARRGRPPTGQGEPLMVTGDADWPDDGRLLLDERAAMRALGVRRTKLHELVQHGELKPRYLGRLKRFLRSDLVACAAALPTRPT